MINKNLSKISEFGIWLIQWFGDFSKDIKIVLFDSWWHHFEEKQKTVKS
jgi:hypothetical protein